MTLPHELTYLVRSSYPPAVFWAVIQYTIRAQISFGSALLVPGRNLIAVEVHQAPTGYDDLLLAAVLAGSAAVPTPAPGPFPTCAGAPETVAATSWATQFPGLVTGASVVVPTGARVLVDSQPPELGIITVQYVRHWVF